jgi:hypothetical protein
MACNSIETRPRPACAEREQAPKLTAGAGRSYAAETLYLRSWLTLSACKQGNVFSDSEARFGCETANLQMLGGMACEPSQPSMDRPSCHLSKGPNFEGTWVFCGFFVNRLAQQGRCRGLWDDYICHIVPHSSAV